MLVGRSSRFRHSPGPCLCQACYRGYRVRRRLCDALKFAQYDDSDGADEFDYDEEVDLTAFDFDARHLDEGWTPSDTPQLPSRYCTWGMRAKTR